MYLLNLEAVTSQFLNEYNAMLSAGIYLLLPYLSPGIEYEESTKLAQ